MLCEGPDCDLALLHVEDERFWADLAPLESAGSSPASSSHRGTRHPALRVETGRDRSVISRKLTEECPKHFVESCIV